jgi:hypothetical protein
MSGGSLGANAGVHANNVCPRRSKARGILFEQKIEMPDRLDA